MTLVNGLPRDGYRPHLGTTRREGPLASEVARDVGRCILNRRRTIDLGALRHLVRYIRDHRIQLIHAHGSAAFMAMWAALLPPFPPLVWHAHYGMLTTDWRPRPAYRLLALRLSAAIVVNEGLRLWACDALRISPQRVRLIPNPVATAAVTKEAVGLPGVPGKRMVCLANLRPPKDHATLLKAVALVRQQQPDVQLFLVGRTGEDVYAAECRRLISALGLRENVWMMGERSDAAELLSACDIGVLSSSSEGLPLALLEYGIAGLAVVATAVGQCAEVLDGDRAGILVPPAQHEPLAEALLSLLNKPARRLQLGDALRERVLKNHSLAAVMPQVLSVYSAVLGNKSRLR